MNKNLNIQIVNLLLKCILTDYIWYSRKKAKLFVIKEALKYFREWDRNELIDLLIRGNELLDPGNTIISVIFLKEKSDNFIKLRKE